MGKSSPFGPFYVEPLGLWEKPVICLVNDQILSTGEGMARGCQRAGIPLVGFTGASGSFGMQGSEIYLPGNMKLTHPFGQARDNKGNIQLDSGVDGIGGNP